MKSGKNEFKRCIVDLDWEMDSLELLELLENCASENVEIALVSKKMDYKDLLMKSTSDHWLREVIGLAKSFNNVDLPKSLEEQKEINII